MLPVVHAAVSVSGRGCVLCGVGGQGVVLTVDS